MTKATYKRHNNARLDKIIAKFGYEHPATISYASQIEILKEPTVDNDIILNHLMYSTLKYGADLLPQE